jgi:hypothetical protein
MSQSSWEDKISNSAQVGGIETAVLDNGLGRGNRIAWVNTGSGLRYKVVLDRAMDIGEAFYQQHSLAWLSHAGSTAPDMFRDEGLDWLKTFGGGLLTTCGLSHVGGPESEDGKVRGLHGRISNTPASIESIVQPDLIMGRKEMSITGRMLETTVFGPTLELKRTISSSIGVSRIVISDTVTNRGNLDVPLMILYHFNFGWPLVDAGSDIVWQGKWRARSNRDAELFREGNEFRKCPDPVAAHRGAGEAVAFIEPHGDADGKCQCGIVNRGLELATVLQFNRSQLPWLSNWQHWGPGEYVTGLEPGTNPPIGQGKAREENTLIMLRPGEQRQFDISMDVVTEKSKIDTIIERAVTLN